MEQNNDDMLKQSAEQDHKEAMRIYSLIHNSLLLIVWAILLFNVTHWVLFTILFLLLWDWSYKK